MTKADIINTIHAELGYSKTDAARLVESTFDIIKEQLSDGESVKISRFGNFLVRKKHARKGRNPQTGEEMVILRRQVITFKASQVLRRQINK
ncbi:MAG: integration host factor subunit alpha [Deltaproteobacteria bacterium]|nr:integration host factor subunit alpha [Deltaproteobacteria bacterium]